MYHPSTITASTITSVLERYQPLIDQLSTDSAAKSKGKGKATPSLAELDDFRLNVLPEKVKKRGYMEKEEVEELIQWKLKHGKFRPTLMSLVSSNSPETIKTTTTSAFKQIFPSSSASLVSTSIPAALQTLTELRGIGPASASLLLSVLAPEDVPFFSDEAFRWIMADEGGDAWSRKIKYDKKEYAIYLEKVTKLRKRLGNVVSASDIERVGFVLGKELVDLDGAEEAEDVEEEKPAKTKKRKVEEPKPQTKTKKIKKA